MLWNLRFYNLFLLYFFKKLSLPCLKVYLYVEHWHFLAVFLPRVTSVLNTTDWFLPVVSLQTSSDDCDPHEGIREGKEGVYRLQVTQFVQRLEYWHKDLTNTLVTSINVVPVHGRTVAYLGTADGRHIQVKTSLCGSWFGFKMWVETKNRALHLIVCRKKKFQDVARSHNVESRAQRFFRLHNLLTFDLLYAQWACKKKVHVADQCTIWTNTASFSLLVHKPAVHSPRPDQVFAASNVSCMTCQCCFCSLTRLISWSDFNRARQGLC